MKMTGIPGAFPSASRLRKIVTVSLPDEFDERRSSDRVG